MTSSDGDGGEVIVMVELNHFERYGNKNVTTLVMS